MLPSLGPPSLGLPSFGVPRPLTVEVGTLRLGSLEFAHPAWLAALVVLAIIFWVWRHWPTPFGRFQRATALTARLVLVAAIILALAGPELTYNSRRQTVVAAAQRSIGSAPAQGQEISDIEGLARHLPGRDQMGVVSFGQNALVENPPERKLEFNGFATSPNPNFTNIQSALQLSASLAAPGTRRHVVLVSDGRQNLGDAVGEARALRSAGVRVDVLPLYIKSGPNVRVDSVQVPSSVPAGSRALATAVLVSNETTTARVEWSLDNTRVVSDKVVSVKPGVTEIHALLPPAGPGFHQVHVQILPARDSVPGNGTGEALFQVLGRQQVLVVQGNPGAGRNVADALRSAGIAADVVGPNQVPSTVPGIARWQSVALVNVSAPELGPERMAAIAGATKDLGTGLAVFGGTGTFGAGGLAGTPLEKALPVEMKVSNEALKQPVAVMLVLETLESNGGDQAVRAAAHRLVANLSPGDLVGVVNDMNGVAIPLQRVGNGQRVEHEIASIPLGDPTSYVPYLQDAAGQLVRHPADSKYIVLLGDGDDDSPLPSPSFMSGLVHKGITVSTIGADVHGSPVYMSYMAQIAAEGDGRFYDSESQRQLPTLFFDETQLQLQPWIVQERFRVATGAPSPALDGINPAEIPPLDGYDATTAKPASQIVLSGPYGDPILAQWRYGLGTATAWTSDTEGRWTAQLLRSPLGGKLLAGVVASTLPLQANPSLSVSAEEEGNVAHVVAQVNGPLPAGASSSVHAVGPGGSASNIPLSETAPGRFEGNIPTNNVGTYVMRVEVRDGRNLLHAATAGVAIAYSPELRYLGTDMTFLEEVAKAGGGVVLKSPAEAFSVPVPPVGLTQSSWFALVLLAAVLLPFDVAVRRLNLGRLSLVRPNLSPKGAGEKVPLALRRRARAVASRAVQTSPSSPRVAPAAGTGTGTVEAKAGPRAEPAGSGNWSRSPLLDAMRATRGQPVASTSRESDRPGREPARPKRRLAGGPATGGPATGGPATGGPATGGPATGGPAKGGPAKGGPAKGRAYAKPGPRPTPAKEARRAEDDELLASRLRDRLKR